MITVACVLRSGGDYMMEHVCALKAAVTRHLSVVPWTFRILTDMRAETPEVTLLREGWPGWWSKIELFRPGQFDGPVLYFDLDTLIVGSLDDLALATMDTQWALLADFYRPERLQSGIMAWHPGPHTEYIYERFTAHAGRYCMMYRGDGEFVNALAEPRPERLQDVVPRQIVSYKRDVLREGSLSPVWTVPKTARVICFHGTPRPWNTPLWKGYAA